MNTTNQNNNTDMHPYQKLGGWLLFIFVCQIIGLVLDVFYLLMGFDIISMLPSGSESMTMFLVILLVASSCISIGLGIVFLILLYKRNTKFLLFYEIISIIFILLSVVTLSNELSEVREFVIQIASFLLWSTYYRKSVRVRTYFGSDEYLRKSIFSRNAQAPEPAVYETSDDQATISCTKCGNPQPSDQKFCSNCGEPLNYHND